MTSIDVIINEPLEIWKDNVFLRDGFAPQTCTSTLTIYDFVEDRWRIYPTSEGTYSFNISSAGYTDSTTINVVPSLSGGAGNRNILFVGDSITAATGSFVKIIKDALGSQCVLLGTQSTAGYNHEGFSGRTWTWFASDPASPMTNVSGNIDISAYLSTLGSTPDMILWNLGANDINSIGGSLLLLDTYINDYLDDAESLIQAWKTQSPSTKHAIGCALPGNSSGVPWGSNANRWFFRQKQHRFVELTMQRFENRELENIFIMVPNLSIDPVNGFTDTVHPNSIGYTSIARVMRHWIVAHW